MATTVPEDREIECRLGVLERDLRRVRRAGAAAVLVLGGALGYVGFGARGLSGTVVEAQRTVVEAQQFIVRDAQGRQRAMLGLDHPSSPQHSPVRLGLYNEASNSSAVLYLSDGFAGLSVASGVEPAVRRAVQLFANPREGGGLKVTTAGRSPAIELSSAAGEGLPRFVLGADDGRVLFEAPSPSAAER
jgi:hypothetical protein